MSDLQATVKAINAADADAKANGLGVGHGGVGSIPCPACGTGTLNYSVASFNGHMWGSCDTKDCVKWMQ